jgi:DNA-binding NtrC family response regulator
VPPTVQPKTNILLLAIDDDPTSLDLVEATLEQEGLEIVTEIDPSRALTTIAARRPQIVISDLMMPGLTGMDVLSEVVRLDTTIDVILLTAHYSTEAAVEAIQKGASDYLNKPIDTRRLRERVDQIIAEARRRLSASSLDSQLLHAYERRGMIGRSPLMLEVFARIERIAPHYRTVLVTGPTGSGKELVARALHQASPVASGPFVVCNAAAIPENLIESELFGHVKGAFTGATQDKAGLFETAHGGTILLDEIGDMPLGAQAKLLRAVQHQEVQRVGASGTRKVNVRIVAATHRDLRSMVTERTFREDLFFRLGMVEIRLPQLAHRKEDLPLLLRHFVDKFSQAYNKPIHGFTRKAEIAMNSYSWPGNIRELEGVVGAAAMMAEPPLIDVGDLPPQVTSVPGTAAGNADGTNLNLSLEDIQVVHAHRVVDSMNGDKVRAAQLLGVSRATLYRLLAKTPPQSRD